MNEQVLDEKYTRNGMKTKRMNIRRKTFPQKKKKFFTFGLVNNKHEKGRGMCSCCEDSQRVCKMSNKPGTK